MSVLHKSNRRKHFPCFSGIATDNRNIYIQYWTILNTGALPLPTVSMNDMKTEPVLITSLTRRLTAIRNEAFSLIRNAVAKHRILGTFYQNLGKHYAHDQTLEQYDTAPIVITHNDSFGTYGGYAAATVYELFIDEKGRLLCTLNGEAGEDFNEPLEHIQIEGLLCIVRWLMKHGLVIDNPWRCEVCGSLAVQEQIWVDTNTCEAYSQAYNRDENYCCNCNENTYSIRESELLQNLDEWWHGLDFRQMERITGYRQDDFDPEDGYQDFVDICDNWWESLSIEEKTLLWFQK